MLKEEWFRNLTIQEGEFWKEIEESEEFIEEEVQEAMERSEEGWKREGKVILWKERIYVPDSATLREENVTKHHDSELAGHPGYTKMHKLITRNYWWPQMLEDIKWYVMGCEKCQANKPNQQPKTNNLYPNEILQGLWETITVDLIGPLLLSVRAYSVRHQSHCKIVEQAS